MPKKIFSKAQWGKLFAIAHRGEMPIHKVKEMAKGVNYGNLPMYKGKGKIAQELVRQRGRSR